MSEFILVRNADDSGHLLLRAETVEGVRDYTESEKSNGYSGNSRIRFRTVEGSDWYDSASTAAEVFAAIQAAQGIASRPAQAAMDAGASGGDGSVFTLRLREGEASSPIVWRDGNGTMLWDRAGTLERLVSNSQAREAMEKLATKREGAGSFVLNDGTVLERGESSDGWTHLFEAQHPLCQCAQYQGDNPACPVHGKGTAWHDLHGER